MIKFVICRIFGHLWRDQKKIIQQTPYAMLSLDVRLCARCSMKHEEDEKSYTEMKRYSSLFDEMPKRG